MGVVLLVLSAFAANVKTQDPTGAIVFAANSAACCALCTADPSCAAAVYAVAAQSCTKLLAKHLDTNPQADAIACVPNRTKAAKESQSDASDDPYQCLFRQLALEYTDDVVLRGWASTSHRRSAYTAVARGLRIHECNATFALSAPQPDEKIHTRSSDVTLYVAPTGDDAAPGTARAPLATIRGAQVRIRALYPPGSTRAPRPALTVLLKGGDYYLPPRAAHAAPGREGSPVFARFTEADSGSSADDPIVYGSDPASPTRATLHGGILLDDLNITWSAAPRALGLPSTTLVATLPAAISIDPQDQLYVGDTPLVRARTPNGRPWLPLDGFNLTAAFDAECGTMPDVPRTYDKCVAPPAPSPPVPYPGTPPAPRAPPTPAVGACSAAVANASLLYAYPKPDIVLASPHTATAEACATLCRDADCCAGYTWHDANQGTYAYRCYWVANPLQVWTRAMPQAGHTSGVCNHGADAGGVCPGTLAPHRCAEANVTCATSGVHQVDGVIGDGFADEPTGLSGDVDVQHCFTHLPDMGNSWPHWTAVGFDRIDVDNATHTFANVFDLSQNAPKWFGPWAGGIVVRASQDAGSSARTPLGNLTWRDAPGTVVHAMADGEWGGVQFEVGSAEAVVAADAAPSSAGRDVRLKFTRGGWQQARPATMKGANRYYMENNIEFLDVEGEWHYDAATRALYVIPPAGRRPRAGSARGGAAATMASSMHGIVLTQSDCLLRFEGRGSAPGERVEHIRFENISFAHTSASFFLPHEESSGGDYAVARSGAIFAENASALAVSGCDLAHLGGNGVVLSNSVRNVTITRNHFQFLGTSGVVLIGRTGRALMDARDGEAMVAAAAAAGAIDPSAADNGVRLPKHNAVTFNIFHDYGIWDKQSAAYHKALAPGNEFSWNVVFNASRHGVNFQDSMGGGGVVDGNVFFSLNRETHDTAALNSWGRRNYLFTDDDTAPTTPHLIPSKLNSWRSNLILARPLGIGPLAPGDFYSHANCLRCDDGASWCVFCSRACVHRSCASVRGVHQPAGISAALSRRAYPPLPASFVRVTRARYNMTSNVCVGASSAMEFNGGTQVFTQDNIFVQGGWTLCASPPTVGGSSHDTYIDAPFFYSGICGDDKCEPLWKWNITNQTSAGAKPALYTGDHNTIVVNTTGAAVGGAYDFDKYFCGFNLSLWQQRTKGDLNTKLVNARGSEAGEYTPTAVVARAKAMLWASAGVAPK